MAGKELTVNNIFLDSIVKKIFLGKPKIWVEVVEPSEDSCVYFVRSFSNPKINPSIMY